MNDFIMLNWYHFDLNYNIIYKLKNNKCNKSKKKELKNRIDKDFHFKIKKD